MKYKIIYADPPWSYRDKRTGKKISGGVVNHYQTMDGRAIKELDVPSISDDNCMLFLWATFPNIQLALDVMAVWGFTYKTLAWSWIKTNKNNAKPFFGIGWYTKSNCEVCLLGVKGKPFKVSNSISSVLIAPRGVHSEKPHSVRDMIVRLCGDVPRIELFARQKTDGWHTWGNEVSNNIEL